MNNSTNYIQPNAIFSLNISVMNLHSHMVIHTIITSLQGVVHGLLPAPFRLSNLFFLVFLIFPVLVPRVRLSRFVLQLSSARKYIVSYRIAISLSAYLLVCMSVCLSSRISQKLHAQTSRNFLCIACYLWPWLSSLLATMQYVVYFRFYE